LLLRRVFVRHRSSGLEGYRACSIDWQSRSHGGSESMNFEPIRALWQEAPTLVLGNSGLISIELSLSWQENPRHGFPADCIGDQPAIPRALSPAEDHEGNAP